MVNVPGGRTGGSSWGTGTAEPDLLEPAPEPLGALASLRFFFGGMSTGAKDGGGGGSAANEDEIDWDDEPATTQAAANAVAAGGRGPATNPQAVPNQNAAVDPAQTSDLSIAAEPTSAVATASEPVPAAQPEQEKDFSTGLADRTLDDEIEKRKARARKFGLPEDSEEIKSLERAKRFGTTNHLGLLNKALPVKQDRKRASEGAADTDESLRKRTRGRPGPGKKGVAAGSGDGARSENESQGAGAYPQWMTEKDRAAADKRKNRFSETTAA